VGEAELVEVGHLPVLQREARELEAVVACTPTPLRLTTTGRALSAEAQDVAVVAVCGTRRTPTSPAAARSYTDTSGTRHAASHRPRRPWTRPSAPRCARHRLRPSTAVRTEASRGGEGRPTREGNGMTLRGGRERGSFAAGQWCGAAPSPAAGQWRCFLRGMELICSCVSIGG
jgi:hypothetical protein